MQIFRSHEIGKERNIFSLQTRLIIINYSNDSEDTGGGWQCFWGMILAKSHIHIVGIFSLDSASANRRFAVVRRDQWNFLGKSKHHNLKQEKIAKK